MVRDEYAIRLNEEDLDGRNQVWITCDGQTVLVSIEKEAIKVIAWADRPVRRKTFTIKKPKGEKGNSSTEITLVR